MAEEAQGISVVVPARNSQGTIGKVLAAICGELRDTDELIVVDDGSQDVTASIAESMHATVLENGKGKGAASARNRGAESASCEWLLFVDSDAVAPSGWRSSLNDLMRKDPDAIQAVYSPRAPGHDASTFYKNFYYNYTFTRRIRHDFITGCGTFFFAVKRDLFVRLEGFDHRIPGATVEDADFAARLSSQGGRILLAPQLEIYHLREYSFMQLMKYEWNMMRAKVLYLLRSDLRQGASLSMARPLEMLPSLLGAPAIWAALSGLVLWMFGAGSMPMVAVALTVIVIGHFGFWKEAVREGGFRGLRASLLTFPDLALILPATIHGVISFMVGRKY